jgi:uncharacterized membrane protein HdeD (DUF308 family)
MDHFGDSLWLKELQNTQGCILVCGCFMISVGTIAILYSVAATFVSVIFLAALLIIGGAAEAIHALRHRSGLHLFMYLLEALFSLAVGMLLLWTPENGAIALTLLMATYFIITGMVRMVTALTLRLPTWGWTLFNGAVNLALGIAVWASWPVSGLWALGLFIGINLMLSGLARVMLASALHDNRFEPAHA